MDKDIYIVRHGRTDYNKLKIWQGSGVDSSLDAIGIEQSQAFYKSYCSASFDLIIHSSLKRSKETVQPFIDDGIDSLVVPEINEISWGFNEGKPHTSESLAEYRRVIGAWSKENYEVAFKGGESAADLAFRVGKFLGFLKTLTYHKVLICSHGRTIRAILSLMQQEPLLAMEKYEHANTGLFIGKQIDNKFSIDIFNNTDHLESSPKS